jgi:hypothetical protein
MKIKTSDGYIASDEFKKYCVLILGVHCWYLLLYKMYRPGNPYGGKVGIMSSEQKPMFNLV